MALLAAFIKKEEMLLIVSCNSNECGLRGSIPPLFTLRKEDLFLSGELCISTVLMSETLSVHYLQRGETNEMLLALPVVIIDWLITFVLKKTPVYFSISWSQAGLFMDLNHPCLETFFAPSFAFVSTPSSSWWSPTVVFQTSLSLSLSIPRPLLLGKASVLTDEISSFPVGTLGPLK